LNSPFIRAESLSRFYQMGEVEVAALNSFSLSVQAGRITGISGPSGSGKSTFLNLLGGLDRPTSGLLEVEGRSVSSLNKEDLALYRRLTVGMIFQSFHLLSAYNALDNVAFPLLFAGLPKRERRKRAGDVLNLVGLYGRRFHRPAELSGGEQQRVAIARALINNPRILLADEPTGNLDSRTSEEIVRLLADLNREQGLTVVLVSHERDLLLSYAHRIVVLKDGRLAGEEETGKG
jgi:putative ABC transport system ATP-binding protein